MSYLYKYSGVSAGAGAPDFYVGISESGKSVKCASIFRLLLLNLDQKALQIALVLSLFQYLIAWHLYQIIGPYSIYTVYNLQGINIMESGDMDDVKQLPSGV